MFRRILYEDIYFELSIGMLGGMKIKDKRRNLFRRVPSEYSKFMNSVVAEYGKLGGAIEPADEGLQYLFSNFIQAFYPTASGPLARVYFRYPPGKHAAEAFDIYAGDDE